VSHLLHIVLKVGDVRAAADYYQAVKTPATTTTTTRRLL